MIRERDCESIQRVEWVRAFDRFIMGVAEASSWVYLLIGVIVTFEVAARYGFNQPTSWVEEISRFGMVWATFFLLAACLNRRQLITITLLSNTLGPGMRAIQEGVTYLLIALLSAVVAWHGGESVMHAIAIDRRTNTALALPYWAFYLPIVLGFVLLLLQALVKFVLLLRYGPLPVDASHAEEI